MRLFVDMDGTVNKFENVPTDKLYEKDFFLTRKPHISVIWGLSEFVKRYSCEVYVLSAYLADSPYALAEKNEWLDMFMPFLKRENRLFVPCGENKLAWVEKSGIQMDETCFLLDDFSKNLLEWSDKGRGIKLLNGMNHTKKTWNGDCISSSLFPHDFSAVLASLLGLRSCDILQKECFA